MEKLAARHGLVPWHIYRTLPVSDRAELIATFQEHNLREGIYNQRLKAKQEKGNKSSSTIGVEDWLG